MDIAPIALAQEAVCSGYGLALVAAPPHLKIGIARNVRDGVLPINGLRHSPAGETTGWYIWAGEELSQDPEFFVPLHVAHLAEWCPAALRYFGLPPGWRFLVSGDHEDVWEDPALRDAQRPVGPYCHGLDESRISTLDVSRRWRRLANDLKKRTTAGMVGIDDRTGATARYRDLRYTHGAAALEAAGIALRQFQQTPARIRPAPRVP